MKTIWGEGGCKTVCLMYWKEITDLIGSVKEMMKLVLALVLVASTGEDRNTTLFFQAVFSFTDPIIIFFFSIRWVLLLSFYLYGLHFFWTLVLFHLFWCRALSFTFFIILNFLRYSTLKIFFLQLKLMEYHPGPCADTLITSDFVTRSHFNCVCMCIVHFLEITVISRSLVELFVCQQPNHSSGAPSWRPIHQSWALSGFKASSDFIAPKLSIWWPGHGLSLCSSSGHQTRIWEFQLNSVGGSWHRRTGYTQSWYR